MKRFVLTLAFVTFFCAPLRADLLQKADEFIKINDYKGAIAFLEPLANQGNAEAQNKLGEIYHNLDSFQGNKPSPIQDYAKAKECYLKAVAQGHGEAACHLGRMYTNGEGVQRNAALARHWYKKGADLGDAQSEVNYYASIDSPFYYVLQKAVDGDSQACRIAATFYQFGGKGVEKDVKKAALYRKKAKQLSVRED